MGRPHGVRGDLIVQVHTDDPDLRFAAGSVLATEPAARGPLTVTASRWHSGRLLVRFAGYADRGQAEELRGTLLVMDSSEVGPAADPEEFRDYELIGLAVLTVAGEPVGVVTDVLHQGQELLVIKPGEGSSATQPGAEPPAARPGAAGDRDEILVPFVAALVPEVDVAAGRLVIDPPPGLLDLGVGPGGTTPQDPPARRPLGPASGRPSQPALGE